MICVFESCSTSTWLVALSCSCPPPRVPGNSPSEAVQVTGDVCCIRLADAQIRHHVAGIEFLRKPDPADEVFGSVGNMPGQVSLPVQIVQIRTDPAVHARHAAYLMAASAAVFR